MKAITLFARYGIFVVLALEFAIFALLHDQFLTIENQLNVLRQNAVITILAVGMTWVILTAGIDLSVGSVVAVASVGCAELLLSEWAPLAVRIPAAMLYGVLLGGLIGLANGFIITLARIPPFVTTLAMMSMARGLVLHHTNSRSVTGLPDQFGDLDDVLPVLFVVFVFAGCLLLLRRTAFGRHVFAVGGNREAAHLCGIRVSRVLVLVYLLNGILAGLGGVLLTMRLNIGEPRSGLFYELDAIAAVVVGGTSLMGGRGSLWGTLAGAFVIGELINIMNLQNVSDYSQRIVIGVVVIVAAFLDRFRTER